LLNSAPGSRPPEDGIASKQPIDADAPIGVFDSGIGGLSVLRHIRAALPHEHLLYVADAGFVPYGEKSEQEIVARSLAIAEFFLQQRIKAMVVACNTATAAAIQGLRARYPGLLLVGVEPGLKPAAALTRTKTVGVLATASTLASAKFTLLHEQIAAATGVRFLLQPCSGLATQVEKAELRSAATATLVQAYVTPLIQQGADTLVLGCTHYPFVQPLIEDAARRASPQAVTIIDTGEAVARQLQRLLAQHGLQRQAANAGSLSAGSLSAFTTGSHTSLATAFSNLLKLRPQVMQITAGPA
jgi:glutamate racemase